MAFTTDQIYTIVQETAKQSLGRTDIAVVDTSSLVSLGNEILSSTGNTECFLNILPQRIGRTIFSYRAYKNKFDNMVRDDFEMGAILQKIKVSMPEAESDPTFDLEDGKPVDQWKVRKPKARQKLFVKRTPYMYAITIQRTTLREAFLSETAMGSFISLIFGEVRNAIELGLENLGRASLNNLIAESTLNVKLLTNYNTRFSTTLTAEEAIYNESFLRYSSGEIKYYSKRLTDMSVLYNQEGETRHTPFELQRIFVNSLFQSTMETQVEYAAFNERFVSLRGYQEVNYWQAADTPMDVIVTRASDETETTVRNVVAVMTDYDAFGMYQIDEDILTTPVNAAARYYNTFYHLKQLWFNDLSENHLIFTLQ